ncbi:MAG TPA: FAD-dependent monooxygenase [Acidobacteriaceae bacterium]|jgi:2-polyprenyl-6-methoxyphenol hydroxylase-like FAD-dependent oxidoreductase
MKYDVVIAGGGPVGLFLACELQLAGVSVLVLERTESPESPLKTGWMGMRGLNFPSVEAFYRRGMLEDVRANALGWMNADTPRGMELRATGNAAAPTGQRFAGHFAGIMLDLAKVDFSDRKYVLGGPSASGGMISLEAIEFLLAERAETLGVDLKRGVEVTDFTESENGVTVYSGEQAFEASWLAGCDGGRSAVRKLAGFEFTGTEPEFTGYTAAVEIADPEKLRPGFNLTENGMYLLGPGPGRIGVVDFDGAAFDRTSTVTLESLQAVLRRVSGTNVTLASMSVASTYTDRARQATTYRKGRVLLAGDAAHIHSPLGGQGLNTGLGDAMNLGWKLAATIKGWAPDGLLDSYTTERHPIGAWAVEWTRAQVAIMRPDPYARAIQNVIRDLIQTSDATSYFVGKISGMSMRYNLPGDHPLIGCSAPDFEFEDGKRVGDFLHDGKALLLDFTEAGELSSLAPTRPDRLKYIHGKVNDNKGLTALFIRPDGFVAWATESQPDAASAEASIEQWLGKATN